MQLVPGPYPSLINAAYYNRVNLSILVTKIILGKN